MHEFSQCEMDTAYDGVHLLAALNLKDVDKAETHGQMTAVIHYKA